MVGPRPPEDAEHRTEAGETTDDTRSRDTTATVLGALVPTALAVRAVAVSVDTDRAVYDRDDPVEITVEFKNRLPVPIEIPTPEQRRWGWTVDGELEATDERRYTRARPSSFDFRAGERKRTSFTWSGRLERVRTGGLRESVVPDPGEYELRVFVATHEDAFEPSDSRTITIR